MILKYLLSTNHQKFQGLTQWALFHLGRRLSINPTKGTIFCDVYKYMTPTKGKIFCDVYKYITQNKWKSFCDVYKSRSPTEGTIFCDVYKSRKTKKETIFCGVYKSISNSPPKNFKLGELTWIQSMYWLQHVQSQKLAPSPQPSKNPRGKKIRMCGLGTALWQFEITTEDKFQDKWTLI